jgi:signal transduction histidine kinase
MQRKTPLIFIRLWLLIFGSLVCFVGCKEDVVDYQVSPSIQKAIELFDMFKRNGNHTRCRQILDSLDLETSQSPMFDRFLVLDATYVFNMQVDHQFDKASDVCDQALRFFADDKSKKLYASQYLKWLLNKGDVLIRMDHFHEAFGYYFKAKEIVDLATNPCDHSYISNRLSYIRYRQANYDEAIAYAERFLHECKFCYYDDDPFLSEVHEIQGAYNNLAWYNELKGNFEASLENYHQALEVLSSNEHLFPERYHDIHLARGVIYGNMGGLYAKLGQTEQAERYLKQSIAINAEPGFDNRDVQTAQIKLANLYINVDRLADAKQLIDDAKQGLDSLPNPEILSRWYNSSSQYYEKIGDFEEAHQYLKLHNAALIKLFENTQNSFGADFVKEFERMEQELSLEKLAFQNRKFSLGIWLSVSILFLISILLYLIYRNWQISRKNVRQLKSLNDHVRSKNEKLYNTVVALQKSESDRAQLLATIIHDLRGPASNTLMSSKILSQESNLTEKQKDLLRVISSASEQSLDFIGELMEEYQHKEKEFELFDIYQMLSDAVDVMRIGAHEKAQTIELTGQSTLYKGSEKQLLRVVNNLIGNAIKFTPHHGLIQVRLYREDTFIVFEIQDSGVGMTPEFQEKIFEQLPSLRRPGTDGEQSFGLGLSIVRNIVEAQNGTIELISKLGIGSTFKIKLPEMQSPPQHRPLSPLAE